MNSKWIARVETALSQAHEARKGSDAGGQTWALISIGESLAGILELLDHVTNHGEKLDVTTRTDR